MHTHNEQLQEKKEQINNNAVERMNRNTFTHSTFPAVKCKQQCFVVIFSSFLFAFESSSGWNVVAMGKWGKMCRCVCVYSVLLWARFCFSFQAFSTTKKRTKSVHCTEVYALYCGDSNFHWLKRVSKLWYELCFSSLRFA